MSPIFKISAALVVSSSLLVAGCATMGQTATNSANNDYVLPAQVNEGYWAATSLIDDEAVVVNFRSGVANNYSFKCNANGSYRQIGTESYKLVPSSTGVGLQTSGNPVFSEIKVTSLVPKKTLSLNQQPSDPEIQRMLPDGLNFNYRYTPTLTPICP